MPISLRSAVTALLLSAIVTPLGAVEVFREDFEIQDDLLTFPPPVGLRWRADNPWSEVRPQNQFGGSNVLYGLSDAGVFDAVALPEHNWDLLDRATVEVKAFAIASASVMSERRITGWSTLHTHQADDAEFTTDNGPVFALRWRGGHITDETSDDYGGGRLEYYDGAAWIGVDEELYGPQNLRLDALRIELDFASDTYDLFGRFGTHVDSLGDEMELLANAPLLGNVDRLVNITLNRNGMGATSRRLASFDDLSIDATAHTVFSDGDVNLDGVVDIENDFETIRTNFFASVETRTDGDLNGDGQVTIDDFIVWRSNAPAEVAALVTFVPEPTTGLAACLLITLVIGRRERRGRGVVRRTQVRSGWSAASLSSVAALILCAAICAPTPLLAQKWNVEIGEWSDDANWSDGLAPDFTALESATIDNGGTAQVSDTPIPPASLRLGPGNLEILEGGELEIFGTVTVRRDGVLDVAAGSTMTSEGFVRVDTGGIATISGDLVSGGLVEVRRSEVSFLPGSSVTAAAELSVDGGALTIRASTISAPGMTVTDDGQVHLDLASDWIPLSIDGQASLEGELHLNFADGPASVGDRFDLIDAGSVDIGRVSLVADLSTFPQGQVLDLITRPGGTHGTLLQAVVDTRLVLNVNRDTGRVEIRNPNAPTITMHSYSISSPNGSLNSSAFNGLADRNEDGGTWIEVGNLSSTGVAEVNATGDHAYLDSTTTALGNIYRAALGEFGNDPDDLVFEYGNLDGEKITGLVEYEGKKIHNNVVLNIDPVTGEAVMQNDSAQTVSFSSYTIGSAEDSLLTAGWNRLSAQGQAGWFATRTTTSELTETTFSSPASITPGDGFLLGTIFNTDGIQDLTFDLTIGGSPSAGAVVYGDLPTLGGTVEGDLNGDGSVDAADAGVLFGLWATSDPLGDLTNDGIVDAADAGVLFGAWTGETVPQSVPEPAVPLSLMCLGALAFRVTGRGTRK